MASTLVPITVPDTDLCDSCRAPASVRATLPSGGELTFCGHHTRQHLDRLCELGADIWYRAPAAAA